VLRSPGFNSPSARQRVYQWWTAAGGTARGGALDIRRGMGHTDLINAYAEIDIALDTFPYSGGLTTLEALWMGVPVVTVSGATFAGRHSTSHLRNAGLDELVAPRVAAYVDTAVALARCPRYLDGMSRGLRQRVAGSSLCDQTAFGASFMALMRWVFQRSEARRNS
jgi:predicted O-linked N-acetylglucosamine transferase (SPINDLY family)